MLITLLGMLFLVIWMVWMTREYLYAWHPAFVFGMQYRILTALVKKRRVYDESPFEARISIYVEEGATIRNAEFLPELINEIYEDFDEFVDFYDLGDCFSGRHACDVAVVFYKEDTYRTLDRMYGMETRGFYVPFLKTMSIKTGTGLCDLETELGKTVRHEFFHYFAHTFFIKGALTEQQEEGCARVFEEWGRIMG